MNKLINLILGNIVFGLIFAVVGTKILQCTVVIVPLLFAIVPLIGLKNKYTRRRKFRVINNKINRKLIGGIKSQFLIHTEFWVAMLIGFLFSIDTSILIICTLFKVSCISFILVNIVWASIQYFMKSIKNMRLPNYFELWNLGY